MWVRGEDTLTPTLSQDGRGGQLRCGKFLQRGGVGCGVWHRRRVGSCLRRNKGGLDAFGVDAEGEGEDGEV